MDFLLRTGNLNNDVNIIIEGSKSETNRLLLLRALYPEISLRNISHSDDSLAMEKAIQSTTKQIDIGHAGTAMRFLTAFFAIQDGIVKELTGSSRMKQRPIKVLVEALRSLGADIQYLENDGYPPLLITGKKLKGGKVSLPADISSQYISALMLVAPKISDGLQIDLQGKVTSEPYIKMTEGLLNQVGIESVYSGNSVVIKEKTEIEHYNISIESDWSSASYFYGIVALAKPGFSVQLSYFKAESLQGDRMLSEIYQLFGVETNFADNGIVLTKNATNISKINLDLNQTPDLAQTIAVTCLGLGVTANLGGLETLKIKETDRLKALQSELTKLGATVNVTECTLELLPNSINKNIVIETFDDHRMAMAFAPLALKVPIIIKDASVVSKSYPGFWNDLKKIGFSMTEA